MSRLGCSWSYHKGDDSLDGGGDRLLLYEPRQNGQSTRVSRLTLLKPSHKAEMYLCRD